MNNVLRYVGTQPNLFFFLEPALGKTTGTHCLSCEMESLSQALPRQETRPSSTSVPRQKTYCVAFRSVITCSILDLSLFQSERDGEVEQSPVNFLTLSDRVSHSTGTARLPEASWMPLSSRHS